MQLEECNRLFTTGEESDVFPELLQRAQGQYMLVCGVRQIQPGKFALLLLIVFLDLATAAPWITCSTGSRYHTKLQCRTRHLYPNPITSKRDVLSGQTTKINTGQHKVNPFHRMRKI